MRPLMSEHNRWLAACYDPRTTEPERNHLSYCAGMFAANEPITRQQWQRAEAIVTRLQQRPPAD